MFGEIGRTVSEEVVLQLIVSKCIPVILYGLEACPLTKSDLQSMDFVSNRPTANSVFLLICRVIYGRNKLKPLKANLMKCECHS